MKPFLLTIMVLLLAGCRTAPHIGPAERPAAPQAFAYEGGSLELPEHWWEVFGDPTLNSLVEEALSNNLTLGAVWYRLQQAEALARRSGANLLPSLDATGRAARREQRQSGNNWQGSDSYSLGIVASYEIDLWGRLRAGHLAEEAAVERAAYDVRAAALSLSGSITSIWFQLAVLHAQLVIIDEQLATNEDYLTAITGAFTRGKVGAADVLQQRQLLEETRNSRTLAESRIALHEHQLAVLLGRVPGSLDLQTSPQLPPLPALPATGLPAEWVQQRPDLLAAWAGVEAAAWAAGAARANQYPRLSLSLGLEGSAPNLRDVLDNWLATLAANLTAPIFDAGQRRAATDQAKGAVRQAVSLYGADLLEGLREVADGLAQVRDLERYLGGIDRQFELSLQASEQVRETYVKGSGSFVRYLTSVSAHQRLTRERLNVQGDLLQAYIGLSRALGGSWVLTPPRPIELASDAPQH